MVAISLRAWAIASAPCLGWANSVTAGNSSSDPGRELLAPERTGSRSRGRLFYVVMVERASMMKQRRPEMRMMLMSGYADGSLLILNRTSIRSDYIPFGQEIPVSWNRGNCSAAICAAGSAFNRPSGNRGVKRSQRIRPDAFVSVLRVLPHEHKFLLLPRRG